MLPFAPKEWCFFMILSTILWGHVAMADPVVLHRSDEAEIRASVSDVAGVDPFSLSVTHFDAFRTSMVPQWSGQGSLKPCDGEAVASQVVSDAISSAESSLLYMNFEQATETLATAKQGIVCATEPIDPSMVARIGFLQGVISIEQKNKSEAWEQFSMAARFDPDLVWDEQYPTNGEGLLKLAKGELASSPKIDVRLTPGLLAAPEGSAPLLYLNAAPVLETQDALQLPPGPNLLQVRGDEGLEGFMVQVETESRPQLFLPQLLTAETLSNVTTEEGRKALSQIINASYDSGTPVYVAHNDGIWRTASGIGSWEALQEPTAIGRAGAARGAGIRPIAWVGTGLTAGALAGTIWSLARARKGGESMGRHSKALEASARVGDTESVNASHNALVDAGNDRLWGYVGVGLGAVLTTTGVIITVPMF
jgi:hypothetical protein